MWLLNVRKLGFDTASNFALGLPKHDLGWPPLRPLFRDNMYKIKRNMSNQTFRVIHRLYRDYSSLISFDV